MTGGIPPTSQREPRDRRSPTSVGLVVVGVVALVVAASVVPSVGAAFVGTVGGHAAESSGVVAGPDVPGTTNETEEGANTSTGGTSPAGETTTRQNDPGNSPNTNRTTEKSQEFEVSQPPGTGLGQRETETPRSREGRNRTDRGRTSNGGDRGPASNRTEPANDSETPGWAGPAQNRTDAGNRDGVSNRTDPRNHSGPRNRTAAPNETGRNQSQTPDRAGDVSVTPRSLTFENGTTRTVTVRNRGDSNLTVRRVAVVGPGASAFEVEAPDRFTLEPGERRPVGVTLGSTAQGRQSAVLRILTEDPDEPQVNVGLSTTDTAVRFGPTASSDTPTVNATVRNATANAPVSVNVSRPEYRNDSVAFDSVSVTPEKNGSFTLNVTADDEPIANATPETDLSNGTEPLGFLSVGHSISDENISNVSFTFRVERERVNDSEREDIALYRYHDDSWNELPTALAEVTESHYVYRVRSPGLSEFAAGKQRPQFEITNASVELTTLSVGDAMKVRVRITNEGDADGTFTAELVLGDETVSSRQLTIASGGMRQTTFERTVAEPGTYEVYVNDFRVGEVTVDGSLVGEGTDTTEGSETSADGSGADDAGTSDIDTSRDLESDASAGLPGFGLSTAVSALLATLLAVRWRER